METAQLHMERMIPELRDLEQKKIFSKSEISAIVAQRNIHEASISKTKSPKPYLRYIDYEKSLEKLRRLRFGRQGGHKVHGKGRITISDYSIPIHILGLYSSAVKRFPESIELWLSYINYSLTQSSAKLISRVLSAAIAAHPTQSRFWIFAAQFEADGDESGKGGGNVDGARKLLMRSLRFFNGIDSIPIWLEWIRIELNFVKMVENRREALGIDSPEPKTNPSPGTEPTTDDLQPDDAERTAMELDQIGDKYSEVPASLNDDINSGKLKGQDALLSGALVKVVLLNAFRAVSDISIFSAVLPLLYSFESSAKSLLLDFTYSNLAELHPSSPKAIITHRTRKLFKYSKDGESFMQTGEELVGLVAETISEIEKVCKSTDHSPSEMWQEFLKFLIDLHEKISELREYITAIILRTLNTLKSKDWDSPELHKLVINHFQKSLPIKECLRLASKAVDRFKDNFMLWVDWLELIIESSKENDSNKSKSSKIFQEARRKFPGSIRIAELNVKFLKSLPLEDENDDEDKKLWNSIESCLEESLKSATTAIKDEPSQNGLNFPALTPTEVYQRALLECTDKISISLKFKFLNERSVLSLNFLRWLLESSSELKRELELTEQIHLKIISFYTENNHMKSNLKDKRRGKKVNSNFDDIIVEEDWKRYLEYLLNCKKDFKLGESLIEKSDGIFGQGFKLRLEKFWMDLMNST